MSCLFAVPVFDFVQPQISNVPRFITGTQWQITPLISLCIYQCDDNAMHANMGFDSDENELATIYQSDTAETIGVSVTHAISSTVKFKDKGRNVVNIANGRRLLKLKLGHDCLRVPTSVLGTPVGNLVFKWIILKKGTKRKRKSRSEEVFLDTM